MLDSAISLRDTAMLMKTLAEESTHLKPIHQKATSIKRVKGTDSKLTYQFKVKLRDITKPPVWRRILVPSHFTFSGLHAVIQESFGWWNEHLYCFGDVPYRRALTISEPYEDDWEEPDYNARTYTIGEFFGEGDNVQNLCYVYDFGDDWIHDITLEKVLPEHSEHASCMAGKGTCPEEDCGGVWGYEEMKQNGEIDAHHFDVEEVREGVESLPPTGYEPW
jgi:hypothetical protein